MFLPSRTFGTALALRSLLVWVGIRAATIGIGLPLTMGAHSPFVLLLVVYLTGHDRALFREHVFLSNVGVARSTLRSFSAVPAIVAEVALHLAVA